MEEAFHSVADVLGYIHWNKKINNCLKFTYYNTNGDKIFNFDEIRKLFTEVQNETICVLLEDIPPSDIIRTAYYIFDKNELSLTSLGNLTSQTLSGEHFDHLMLNKYILNRKFAIKCSEVFITVHTAWRLFTHLYANRILLQLDDMDENNVKELAHFSPIFTKNLHKRRLLFISD